MKLIHLSDLHLGKRVNEFSMIEDQAYIVKKILGIVKEEKPDAVLIAGDIYDKSVPSVEAVGLFDDFLKQLSWQRTEVFIISGNHDSPERLSFASALIEASGIHIAPVYHGDIQPIALKDDFGTVNIYMLPFIKPAHVRAIYAEEKIESYTDAVRVAIAHMGIQDEQGIQESRAIRKEQDIQEDRAIQKEQDIQEDRVIQKEQDIQENPDTQSGQKAQKWQRNILLTHQFVTGAKRSESEEISVGGSDNVDASVFAAFDYVALGHIHGAQSVGRESIRYCGTPLKYSFSEAGHHKSVTVLELREKGNLQIRTVDLVPLHDLRELRGTYEELTNKKNYEGTALDDYVHITLTDEEDVLDAIGKLRVIYPNLMKLDYDNRRTRENREIAGGEDVEAKTPLELIRDFYEKQNNQPMNEKQEAFIAELMENIWEDKG